MEKKEKILIVGRGLAGAVLSLRLAERGVAHDIVDQPNLSQSSKVAAGIVNPIVLKRLRLVENAQQFLQAALLFYENQEKEWGAKFCRKTPIHHIFQSVGEQNLWQEKSGNPVFEDYLGDVLLDLKSPFQTPFGIGQMKNTGWLDVPQFLDLQLQNLHKPNLYFDKKIDGDSLKKYSKTYQKIVLCNGHLLRELYPKTSEMFSPTRGELLIVRSAEIPETAIWHGPVFVLPLGNQTFKVGATFHWENLTDAPTTEGLEKLKNGLAKIFKGRYQILEHQAGVRPNVKDRKPLLGKLENNLFFFNGLGSRGALMAPHLAEVFLDFALDGKPLPKKWDIKRFLAKAVG